MSSTIPSAFHRACRLIGSYAAVGSIFDPPVSPQGVAKWADAGVPGERVLRLAQATTFQVTPHDLRPDIYPNPTDGLPPAIAAFRAFEAMLDELDIVRPDERATLAAAFERGEEDLVRAVESLELQLEVRGRLLEAARRAEVRA